MDAFFRTLPGLQDAIERSPEVRESVVFAAWRRVAGGQITERTAPLSFETGRLVIAVENKNWQRNLEDLVGQLLFKLNALLGTIKVAFIEFRIDSDAIVRSDPLNIDDDAIAKEALRSLSPVIRSAATAIEDKDLRETFLQAAANCTSRAKNYGR